MYKYAFICVLALLTSCSSDDSNDLLNNQDNFFALEVGNQWTYKFLSRQGSQDENFIDNGKISIHTIVGKEEIDGFTFFKKEIEYPNCDLCSVETVFLRQDGSKLVDNNGNIYFHKEKRFVDILSNQNDWGSVFLKYIGEDTFEIEDNIYNTETNLIYAVKPQGDLFPGDDIIHYSPKIGLVFRTLSSVSSTLHSEEQYLIDFQNVLEN